MDFSNRTFSVFFEDEFDVDIYAAKYGASGNSKGCRLRTFVELEFSARPILVAQVLRALWSHSEDEAFEGRGTEKEGRGDAARKRKLFGLVQRLESSDVRESEWAVSFEASGIRKDYALDPRPIGSGGAASITAATHKASGQRVAFKKLLYPSSEDARARLKREIEVCRALADNDGVVDLLDADPGNTWYVMPLADGDLNDFRDGLSPADVVDLFQQICAGIAGAHEKGYLHRDLKPANILRFGARWVVADWGLVRRPRGQTTSDRTRAGEFYGTEGFAAPEAWQDAHQMDEASDVYSLGQILGWIPEGVVPIPNMPPAKPGRWRLPAGRAAMIVAEIRPSLQDFVAEVAKTGAPPPPEKKVDEMVAMAARAGGAAKIDAGEALGLASKFPDERMLYDVLPRLAPSALQGAIRAAPALAMDVVRQYDLARGLVWGRRDFDYANSVVEAVLLFAREAVAMTDIPLLSTATSILMALDEGWDRFRARGSIREWLASLSGYDAKVVARILSGRPAKQKSELASRLSDKSDADIVAALQP